MTIIKRLIDYITSPFKRDSAHTLLNVTWKSSGQIAMFLAMPVAKVEVILRNLAQNNVIRFIGNAELEGVHIGLRYALEDFMQVLKDVSVPPQKTTLRQIPKPKPATTSDK